MQKGNDKRNEQSDKKPADNNQLQQIKELGAPLDQSPIHVVSVIGQIEGHTNQPPQTKTTKYEHVLPQLAAIEDNCEIEGAVDFD